MTHDTSSWHELFIEPATENNLDLLLEMGVAGAELRDSKLRCWIDDQEINLKLFIKEISLLNLKCISNNKVEQRNWVSACQELWEDIIVGDWKIIPISEINLTPQLEKNVIPIIPGSGFGTGHHPTTKLMLNLMQQFATEAKLAGRILDIGTGSGILAIAAARGWGSQVLGVDIDQHAIRNAFSNCQANNLTDEICLIEGTADCVKDSFKLIFANLLSEILLDLVSWLAEHTEKNSLIFLSGILDSEVDMILDAYRDNWILEERLSLESWAALALRRK
ncbi:MAG: 50S ribosomal protein L11 methyltransferase [Bdellovibrionota bacterium]